MNNKKCSKCEKILPATEKYFKKNKGGKFNLYSMCKICESEKSRIYYKSNKEKILDRCNEYYKSNKENILKTHHQYYQNNTEMINDRNKNWWSNHRNEMAQYRKKYSQTKKGRQAIGKKNAKRRQLGYIELFDNPFDNIEDIEWHHINNSPYVVALPKDLHRLYLGKYHKEKCMEIIKQIYL